MCFLPGKIQRERALFPDFTGSASPSLLQDSKGCAFKLSPSCIGPPKRGFEATGPWSWGGPQGRVGPRAGPSDPCLRHWEDRRCRRTWKDAAGHPRICSVLQGPLFYREVSGECFLHAKGREGALPFGLFSLGDTTSHPIPQPSSPQIFLASPKVL